MNREELRASEMLLDMGVRLPVRPLRWLGRGRKPGGITLRRPYTGTLIAMARYYNRIGARTAELKNYGTDEWARLMEQHGKDIARIVACALCRGYLTYHLFHKAVAWWLLWRVHPILLGDAMLLLMESMGTTPFYLTISSAEMLNVMKPRLSQ